MPDGVDVAETNGRAARDITGSPDKQEFGMDAAFTYVVKFWVDPKGADTIMQWLDSKHTAEVVAQPGFRWVRRVRFEENAPDGWHAYMMIYGLESRDALMRYFESDAPKRYAQERKGFEHQLRTERGWGKIDFRIG